MNESSSSLFGKQDQELLFKAFAHYIAKTTKKSLNIIIGMIRMSIQDVTSSTPLSVTRSMDEKTREEMLVQSIDEFLKRAKIGSVHRKEIKSGCLNIYYRWKDIKEALSNERDIELVELLEDESSNIVGYEDQEVLLSAFTHYINKISGKDIGSIAKMIRVCMLEVTIPRKLNFKETRYLDADTREEMIMEGINEYIKKTKTGDDTAELIRADCMKVYDRWKEIRRIDPERDQIHMEDLV